MGQVFVRELVSNASDALEKFRYLSLTGTPLENAQRALEIKITADKEAKTLTIQVRKLGIFLSIVCSLCNFYFRMMALE